MTDLQTERFVASLEALWVEPSPEFVTELGRRVREGAIPGADSSDARTESGREPATSEMVDYLPRPVERTTRQERSGWGGVAVAVAATIVAVVGALLVADGYDGDSVIDPATTPDADEPIAPSVETVPPYTAEDVAPLGGVRDERYPEPPEVDDPPSCAGAVPGESMEIESVPGWRQICDAVSFDGATMKAVVAAGPGLVAVGGETWCDDGSEECSAASPISAAVVWTSVDGLTWVRVPHDEEVFGGPGLQRMLGLTVGGPGLVAVGRDGSDEQGDAAVWTSVDGLTWTRVPHDEEVFGGPGEQRMVSVTAGGPGLVAVGRDGSDEQGDAAVWTSVDGSSWSRVADDEAVFGGADAQTMSSVAVRGSVLVAVGSDGPFSDDWDEVREGRVEDAAVWTSVDGLTWSRVPHDEAVFGGPGVQRMLSVTAGGPGFVAVGRSPWGSAMWTSVDGSTWSRSEDAEVGPMRSVTAAAEGLVAVGRSFPIQAWSAMVWTSPDGLAWSGREGNTGYAEMLSVTVGGPGLVAVGLENVEGRDGWQAAVWVTSLED